MAIDTATKRRAVIQLPGLCFAPVADGVIDIYDRMQAAYIYPFGTSSTTVPISFILECWSIEKKLEFKAAFKALTLWPVVKPLKFK